MAICAMYGRWAFGTEDDKELPAIAEDALAVCRMLAAPEANKPALACMVRVCSCPAHCGTGRSANVYCAQCVVTVGHGAVPSVVLSPLPVSACVGLEPLTEPRMSQSFVSSISMWAGSVCVGLAASPALQCFPSFHHMALRWIFASGGVAPSYPPPPFLPAFPWGGVVSPVKQLVSPTPITSVSVFPFHVSPCCVVLCCVVLCCVVLSCVVL
jgi:hypothetical protein